MAEIDAELGSLELDVIDDSDRYAREPAGCSRAYLPALTASPSWTSKSEEVLITTKFLQGATVVWENALGLKRIELSAPGYSQFEKRRTGANCNEYENIRPEHSRELRPSVGFARFELAATPALVLSGSQFSITLLQGGAVYETPLPERHPTLSKFTAVFPLPVGVIFETADRSNKRHYYVMRKPLEELQECQDIDEEEELIFCSADFFLLTTRNLQSGQLRFLTLAESSFSSSTTPGERESILRWEAIHTRPGAETGSLLDLGDLFYAHNTDGTLMLCFVASERLYALELQFSEEKDEACRAVSCRLAFTIADVVSARGVSGRREAHLDIFCLTKAGQLLVYFGQFPIVNCLPFGRLPTEIGVMGIRDAVGGRANLVADDGSVRRVSMENLSFADPLTCACLSACENSLTTEDFARFLRRIYAAPRSPVPAASWCTEPAWTLFCQVSLGFARPETRLGAPEEHITDWDILVQMHDSFHGDVQMVAAIARHGPVYRESVDCGQLVTAIHEVYEESRLSVLTTRNLTRLASLNAVLASFCGHWSLVQRYRLDHGDDIVAHRFNGARLSQLLAVESPNPVSDIFDWLTSCLERNGDVGDFQMHKVARQKHQSALLSPSSSLLQKVLISFREISRLKSGSLDRALHAIVQSGFQQSDLESLHCGLRSVLADVLMDCRASSRETWPVSAYSLIGRDDMATEVDGGSNMLGWTAVARLSHQANRFDNEGLVDVAESRAGHPLNQKDAVRPPVESHSGGHTADGAKLRFGADKRVEEVERLLGSSDPVPIRVPDGEEFQVSHAFMRKLLRPLAASVGRGAFALHSYQPPDPTEKLAIPKISLSGILVNRSGALVSFEEIFEEGETEWPEFHNGAASGLRVVRGDSNVLTRTWIVYNRPTEEKASAVHAGFLLALGVSNHLPSLRITDWYQYLLPRHELTSLALMLGIGACHQRTMHPIASKLLGLHIRHFNAAGFSQPDWNVTVLVQAAALVGMGLLYLGSSQRSTAEGMIYELTRRALPSEDPTEQPGLVLAAGFALGMVCLGVGSSNKAIADLRIGERLSLYICGGRREKSSTDLGNGSEVDVEAVDPELFEESDNVPLDTTAPGAIIAIALLYLRTNDATALRWVPLPESALEVRMIRPHHVLLRVLARSLIMWESIQPKEAWILGNIPEILRRPGDLETEASPAQAEETDVPDSQRRAGEERKGGERGTEDLDSLAIPSSEIRAMAICGACMAIGLKFAGTAEPRAFDVLMRALTSFSKAKSDGSHMVCANAAALAVSIVMAGTGNLTCLRKLRKLQARRASKYGSQMAVCLAIGILFLGGGSLTFDNSNESVAVLLCALYPRFPRHLQDNRYHLQALRHLYALAAKPRLLEAREVETGAPAYVPVSLKVRGSNSLFKATTPCLLGRMELIETVSVDSPRYWPLQVSLENGSPGHKVLHVKRNAAHLPYGSDPRGVKGILARAKGGLIHQVSSFTVDPVILGFARNFCTSASMRASYYEAMLQNALAKDKPELIVLFLDLELAMGAGTKLEISSAAANLQLIRTHLVTRNGQSHLLDSTVVSSASARLWSRAPGSWKVG